MEKKKIKMMSRKKKKKKKKTSFKTEIHVSKVRQLTASSW